MRNKKHSLLKKSFILLTLLILFFVCTFFIGYFTTEYFLYPYNLSEPLPITVTTEVSNDDVKFTEVQGITNILLLSTDNNDSPCADSIMLLTIDNINKKLKLTSLLPNMLVDIKNHGEDKLNQAFAYGEAGKTIETIQNNFGIKIDSYAMIDFTCFKHVIDKLDGVTIDIKSNEIIELNNNIKNCGGTEKDLIHTTGTYNLNGIQTLAYSRTSNIDKADYDRVERQINMFQATINKLKDSSPLTLTTLLNDLFPYIKTNISIPKAINYTLTALKIGNTTSFNIDQFTIPINNISKSAEFESKGCVIITDKIENSKALEEFIFNDNKDYKPDPNNLSEIINKCYVEYGNMDEDTAEASIYDIPIEEEYLYDYSKELNTEDFIEDNWSNKTNNASKSLDDQIYLNDLDYSDCDESWD